jgi:hypothetical protein
MGSVPCTPVVRERPVAFVSVTDEGVPRFGEVKVGDALSTLLPLPVEVVTPVPPFAVSKVPPKVIAPDVADAGVSPVVPPETVVTPFVLVKSVAADGMEVPFTEVVEPSADGISEAESVVPTETRPLRSVVTLVYVPAVPTETS